LYILAPPTLDLDFRDKLTIRVGEAFALTGRYSGKPKPKVSWFKDEADVLEDDRTHIKTTPTTLALEKVKAKRSDSGKYCVVVENSTGSRKGFCQVNVVGKYYLARVRDSALPKTEMKITFCAVIFFFSSDRPGPPVGPVIFDEVTKDHMIISWKPPLDDGGSEITNYIIEKKEVGKDVWMPVTSASAKTTCKVSKLLTL